jgi:hypothetical protein
MRTDIPAFYSKWFLNRLEEGYVMVRNPYNPSSVTKYSLSPKVVDVLAFCTKNPAPLLPHMDVLKPYGQYWFVTITPYGKEIEPNVPLKEDVIEDFKTLSNTVGVDCVGWRYDPVFITNTYTIERHIADFEAMAASLCGYTKTCVISFIDLYKKVQRNFPEAREVKPNERIRLGKAFAEIGKRYGMTIKSCAEGTDLAKYGVDCGGCMTVDTFETALKARLKVPKRKSPRAQCACLLGNDIGNYDTCGHLCRYCYANANAELVKQNMARHNPNSPFLLGELKKGDVVHEAKQESWLNSQLSFL